MDHAGPWRYCCRRTVPRLALRSLDPFIELELDAIIDLGCDGAQDWVWHSERTHLAQ